MAAKTRRGIAADDYGLLPRSRMPPATVVAPLGRPSRPASSRQTGITNGVECDTVLKMFGDINGDGKMVYVEYTCDTRRHP